jgi:ABC-2 type transport system ATP-binding protein
VDETWEAKRHLGIVPETSNVYDDLSAWDNLLFTGDLYNVPRRTCETKARELLEIFDLAARRNDRVHGFSKGMKRRLTLAMGLINAPRILFLDEPTSGLDVQSNLIIRQVINDLHTDGVTVFLTTHNIEEANLLCDRVAIVNHGRIAAIDAPERLKKTIQSAQSIEVAFDRAENGLTGDLSVLPLVNAVRKEGDKFRVFTNDPTITLPALVGLAREKDLKIFSLVTLGPSLEDVFIRLTGIAETRTRLRGNASV